MSAKEQIGMEVRNVSLPFVQSIVLRDFLNSPRYLSGNEVSIKKASSIPMDVFSVQKMKNKT